MNIPYTVDRRADTGVTNVTLGIWLFLASEVMLFGALFSAYALLRVSAVTWPHGADLLSWPLGGLNTAILALMTRVSWRARSQPASKIARHLWGSSLFAAMFLAAKATEYSGEIAHGFVPSASTFLAMYFTLTGLHALHVICGLIANLWAATGLRRVGEAMTIGRVRALSLYWVLVDLVWLIIVVLFYLS